MLLHCTLTLSFRPKENISISAILLFQNLITIFDKSYMFSKLTTCTFNQIESPPYTFRRCREGLAWGDVSTRERMIESSEQVYRRLVLGSSDPNMLKFEVLARVAKSQNGCLDQDKLSDLIRLLRPNRDGT
jgi:hypothetical protein